MRKLVKFAIGLGALSLVALLIVAISLLEETDPDILLGLLFCAMLITAIAADLIPKNDKRRIRGKVIAVCACGGFIYNDRGLRTFICEECHRTYKTYKEARATKLKALSTCA